MGLRPADGGKFTYYDVGKEHLAFLVDPKAEVDSAYERCLKRGAKIHTRPSTTTTSRATTRSSSSTRTASGSRSSWRRKGQEAR